MIFKELNKGKNWAWTGLLVAFAVGMAVLSANAGPMVGSLSGGGGAPIDAPYLTSTSNADLSAEVNLGALATGLLYGTVAAGTSTISSVALGTGVATFLTTPSSANLATALTDETGSGLAVYNSSPTIAAPALSGATPYFSMRDTNAAQPTRDLFTFTGDATDVGDGTEDFDIALKAMIGGSLFTFLNFDADGLLSLGYNGQTTNASAFTVGTAGSVAGNVSLHDAGAMTFYDDGNDTSVAVGPVADGTTTLGVTGSLNISTGLKVGTSNYPAAASTTGAYMRADGTNWIQSTVVLPNAGDAFYLPVFTAANTMGQLASSGQNGQFLIGQTGAVPIFSDTFPGTFNLSNGSTSAGGLYFVEDSDNGTNKVLLKGPDSTADVTIELPAVAGTVALTQVPTTVGSGAIEITTKSAYVICTGACQVTLPAAAAGNQYCVRNAPGSATIITLVNRASQYYELTDHSAWATVNQKLVSGGVATDSISVVGYDGTHYATMNSTGTWTDTAP